MGVDLLHGVLDQLGAVGSEELCIEERVRVDQAPA
jgi:hypothetical protein